MQMQCRLHGHNHAQLDNTPNRTMTSSLGVRVVRRHPSSLTATTFRKARQQQLYHDRYQCQSIMRRGGHFEPASIRIAYDGEHRANKYFRRGKKITMEKIELQGFAYQAQEPRFNKLRNRQRIHHNAHIFVDARTCTLQTGGYAGGTGKQHLHCMIKIVAEHNLTVVGIAVVKARTN